MANSLNSFSTRPGRTSTPQTQKSREDQVQNNAGGFVFKVSDLDRVKRFLILGSDKNFYQSGESLTKENAQVVIAMAQADSKTLVDLIVEISTQGRAAKQQPGLFALAIASSYGSTEEKQYALSKLSEVARTASTLFTFLSYVQQFRGWGRALQRAVANWYHDKPTDSLSYQIAKYKSRDGFSHRDVFRLSHLAAKIVDRDGVEKAADRQALGEYVLRDVVSPETPRILQGMKAAHAAPGTSAGMVQEYGLSWEMLPSEELNNAAVWTALLNGSVPLGALLRQLPRLTNLGLLASGTPTLAAVMARLTDEQQIQRARIHPVNVLIALKTYASGRSMRGSTSWTPNGRVVDALDEMFYKSFQYVQSTGKRYLIGLDVSGSMSQMAGDIPLSCYEAEAAIAMTLVQTEENVEVVGFTTGSPRAGSWTPPAQTTAGRNYWGYRGTTVTPLPFGRRQRLDDVLKTIGGLPFGGTDTAATFQYAQAKNLQVDTFITITDNETYAGQQHTHEALESYRAKSGIRARSIVLGVTASAFTIADPSDPLQLDIAGFDSAVPQIISEFSKGI